MNDYIERLKKYEEEGYLERTTLNHELAKAYLKNPDKIAVIDAERSVTYKELMSEIAVCAGGLKNAGIKKGDNVLLQLPNRIEFIVTLMALCQIGASPILMLTSHREKEIVSIGNITEASAYISTSDFMGVDYSEIIKNILHEIPSIHSVIISGLNEKMKNEKGWYELYREDIAEEHTDYSEPDDTALYLLSGGTTGVPKVIPRLHKTYACMINLTMQRSCFNENTVYLAVLSISHDFALANPGVLGTLFAGGTAILCETASFDEAFDMIERCSVTTVSLVPAVARVWAEAIEWYEADFSSMEHIIFGAAKIDKNIVKLLMQRMNVKIQNAYGLGEGITCCTELDEPEEIFMNTQGKPVSKADEMIIVDDDGNELQVGEEGELAEKGPYTFGGYYKNPELNEKCFIKGGYFRTGDKAMITSEGNLVILGRTVEQINRCGENIIPSEIETFLMKHSEIKESAVFGVPDEAMGEKTVACIVTDNKKINRIQICSFLERYGVASYKFPDCVMFLEKLPYKNIGKVDKNKLREIFMEENK